MTAGVLSMSDVATADRSESSLVAAAQDGDMAAFEALYRQYSGRTYALCLRMCGNPSRAEELAQDAFVRAWEKLNSFRGDSRFGTWLHRLTVNVVLTEARSRGRREARVAPVEDPGSLPVAATGTTPGLHVDLEEAVAALPEGARVVFVLHDIEGYRHQDIADMTGSAVGTCKAQLFRARRLLREKLQ